MKGNPGELSRLPEFEHYIVGVIWQRIMNRSEFLATD
jgi:hypothetical protein